MAALQGDDLEAYLRLAAAGGAKNGKIEQLLSQVGAGLVGAIRGTDEGLMWVLGAGCWVLGIPSASGVCLHLRLS